MTSPAPRPFPTLRPPPTQRLAVAYFTPLLTPLPVGTRIPQPGPGQETIDYFIRVEPGGGTTVDSRLLFRVGIVLHSYCPNNDETVGEDNLTTALAWGANAMGTSVELRNGETVVCHPLHRLIHDHQARRPADQPHPLQRHRPLADARHAGQHHQREDRHETQSGGRTGGAFTRSQCEHPADPTAWGQAKLVIPSAFR